VAFWKALELLYRLVVLVASLDDFLRIVQAKKGVTLLITRPNPADNPDLQPKPNLDQIDNMTTIGIVSSNRID